MLVFASSRAQVIFQDSFEYTDPDPYYMYNRGGWQYDAGSLRPEEGEGPSFPVGPTEGIQPKTGNKMFDFRASTFALQEREIFRQKSSTLKPPVTECSVAFCYRPSVVEPHNLAFKVFASGIGLTAEINASRTTMTLTGLLQTRTAAVTLETGRWYTFKYRMEWSKDRITCYIDNSKIFDVPDPNSSPTYDVHTFRPFIRPLSNTASKYGVFDGAPGVFLDDYRLIAVPEPSSGLVLASALVSIVAVKNRRKARK
ncbi:MAG: hypothetical protein JNM04_03425 [Chthonomonas sp.]|nr:hypothetical protein [Chthonomonas sp.]